MAGKAALKRPKARGRSNDSERVKSMLRNGRRRRGDGGVMKKDDTASYPKVIPIVKAKLLPFPLKPCDADLSRPST